MFEDQGTDRQNWFQNVLSKTFQMIAIWHACQSWKLVWRWGKQYSYSPVTLGGGITWQNPTSSWTPTNPPPEPASYRLILSLLCNLSKTWYRQSQADFFSQGTDIRGTDKIQFCQFRTFLKKKNNFGGFPWCSTRENLSIDVSITNVWLILTKQRWFQLFVTSQNSNFKLFWKKNQIFGFQWCSTLEDFSIDVSITIVVLILTKLRWFQVFVTSQN